MACAYSKMLGRR